jgi:hypothetical protein
MRWVDELTVKILIAISSPFAPAWYAEVSSADRRLGVDAPGVLAVQDLSPLIEVPLIVSRCVR